MERNEIKFNQAFGKKNCCVSIRASDHLWVKEHHYSLSRILTKAIDDLKNKKSQDSLEEMFRKIQSLSKVIQQYADFTEGKGLADAFFKFQDISTENDLKPKKDQKPIKDTLKEETTPEEEADKVLNDLVPKEKEEETS